MTTATTTTFAAGDVTTALSIELAEAREQLAAAKTARRCKDTPAARAAVVDAQANMDAVLDMYLTARKDSSR